MDLDAKEQLIVKLGRNPRLAHQAFFAHRHPNETPWFHYPIIDIWHDDTIIQAVIQAFRGAAKSTIAEEAIIVQSLFRRFKNGIILGETEARAIERLRAIKHEFESNEFIEELFGNMVGGIWSEGKITLSNGVIIQAFGRGQSLRGSKHLDTRPDRAFADDIENEESVQTPAAIDKTVDWLVKVVIPALDPNHLIRINGTPLSPNALICKLEGDSDWKSLKIPIKYKNEDGEWVSSWPTRFPIDKINVIERSLYRLGKGDAFQQEYMCEAEDPAEKPFKQEQMLVIPTIRAWQTVYSVYDPARTVTAKAATTGAVHFSWSGHRLIIWDAYGERWMPDEIIKDIFEKDDLYHPVVIGVEADGLKEFILQPLRNEQVKRGYAVPIRELQAPRDRTKDNFIKALQPFFKAGEIIFAKPLPSAIEQFLAYPSGAKDIPNALAYALQLRPGQLVYDTFDTNHHVYEDLIVTSRDALYLCLNAKPGYVTAILIQINQKGQINILEDWVYEGDSSERLKDIVSAARLSLGSQGARSMRFIVGAEHLTLHHNSGLRQAARRIPIDIIRGGNVLDGREELKGLLKLTDQVRIASRARWTLNAFAAGYAREINKHGQVTEFPVDNCYRTLIEGLETCMAMMKAYSSTNEQPVVYDRTSDGRSFISSRGGMTAPLTKDNWHGLNNG